MMTQENLLPPALNDLRARVLPFCRRHHVAVLEVFGSLARGEAGPDSDIDLLITFQPGVRLGWDFFQLEDELESLLGRKVDLLTRRSVERDENPIRRRSILESAREIYTG